MEKQLHDLINEKRKIEYSLKNEEEYNRTIEYMLEDEQNRLFSIKKESYSIEEKIKKFGDLVQILDKKRLNYIHILYLLHLLFQRLNRI